ncbi:MAG: hypothetical protein IAE93_04610 [Ignavibacteria bacterium]|nr:hypothetical protein [Ignavibacteria bacterium]
MKKNIVTATLLHIHAWAHNEIVFRIDEELFLCNTRESNVWDLYEKMCKKHKIDEGDPFLYDTHILSMIPDYRDSTNPNSIIGNICNLLSLIIELPIPASRTIISEDNFKTFFYTSEDFIYGEQTELLLFVDAKKEKIYLNETSLMELRRLYETNRLIKMSEDNFRRLNNALLYFFNSWCRVHFIEQTCVNLSICLESLFSPNSTNEIAHQISFNICHFIGCNPIEKEEIYKKVKRFYAMRSKIVHGSYTYNTDIVDTTRDVFVMTCKILKKILLNEEILLVFKNKLSWDLYFKRYIFE